MKSRILCLLIVVLVNNLFAQKTQVVELMELESEMEYLNPQLIEFKKRYEVVSNDYKESKEIYLKVSKRATDNSIYDIKWGESEIIYLFTARDITDGNHRLEIFQDNDDQVTSFRSRRKFSIKEINKNDFIPKTLYIDDLYIEYEYVVVGKRKRSEKEIQEEKASKAAAELDRMEFRSIRYDYFNMDDYIDNYTTDINPQVAKLMAKYFIHYLDSPQEIRNSDENNTVKAKCRIRFHSPETSKYARVESDCDHLPIDYINVLYDMQFKMPIITEQWKGREYRLNREFYMDCQINLVRGTTSIKHKKGKHTKFIVENTLTEDQKKWITQKFIEMDSGTYDLRYQFGSINDASADAVIPKKRKRF